MAFKMKGFKAHNMYKTEKANTHEEHLALKKKGYDHSPYNKTTYPKGKSRWWQNLKYKITKNPKHLQE